MDTKPSIETYALKKKNATYLPLTRKSLQKGGIPAAPSGTATLLRLSPSH